MQRHIALIFAAGLTTALASPPKQDRQAILKMAGNFKVTFDFDETYPIASDYKTVSKPYHEESIKVVSIAEETRANHASTPAAC